MRRIARHLDVCKCPLRMRRNRLQATMNIKKSPNTKLPPTVTGKKVRQGTSVWERNRLSFLTRNTQLHSGPHLYHQKVTRRAYQILIPVLLASVLVPQLKWIHLTLNFRQQSYRYYIWRSMTNSTPNYSENTWPLTSFAQYGGHRSRPKPVDTFFVWNPAWIYSKGHTR